MLFHIVAIFTIAIVAIHLVGKTFTVPIVGIVVDINVGVDALG